MSQLEPLYAAFEAEDVVQLLVAYDAVVGSRRVLRIAAWMIERAYPLRQALQWACKIEGALAEHGLRHGSRKILEEFLGEWTTSVSPLAEPYLREGAAVFFGVHPSLLTPFLVAQRMERGDLRSVSTQYICHLLPSFGAVSFPVEVPLAQPLSKWRFGGFRRALVFALVAVLERRGRAREDIKEANRRSIQEAIEHVRSGGCLLICPDGGEPSRRRRWYPGIAVIADALVRDASAPPVHFVPFFERNSSSSRVRSSLRQGPVAWMRRSWYKRKPVEIEFAAPLLLSQLAQDGQAVEEILAALMHFYGSSRSALRSTDKDPLLAGP